MRRDGLETWLIAGAGLVAWVAVILLPLLALFLGGAFSARPEAAARADIQILGPALRSVRLAAIIAAGAVLLGWVPGRILGTARGYQTPLLLVLVMPLLLPRYMLYYAWMLLLSPTSALGGYIAGKPAAAKLVASIVSPAVMVLWYWPLAALLIAQGWRTMDKEAWEAAKVEAGGLRRFVGVALPMLARPLALALGVCFALCLAEFGTFHLAGVRTVGTELAALYDQTGDEGLVARAAWPMGLVGLVVGLALWKRSRDWSVNPPTGRGESEKPGGRRWAVLATLIGLSLLAPIALLAANLSDLEALRRLLTLHTDDFKWSLVTSCGAACIAVLIASGALAAESVGRFGRGLSAVAHTTIFLAMFLPGSVIAAALLKMLSASPLTAGIRQGWLAVSAGQAARFAGIALILLRLARDGQERHLSEMASADGAGATKAMIHVHLPRIWPVVLGAFLLVIMLSMTELSAGMVLLPAGLPSFAQRLLNQMHYARDQDVISSCLVLIVAYALLAAAVVALLRLVRASRAPAVLLCAVCLLAAGCGGEEGAPQEARVVRTFGRTGRGRCEFVYPRAIDIAADGSLFVADKTGVIQRLTREGEFIGAFSMPKTEAGKPTGLSVGPDGNLYVADTHYHRVMVLSPAGELIRQFGKFGQGPGEFIYPTDVAFAGDGRIFVSEYGGNDRISVFSSDGDFLYSFGRPGSGDGQLARPSAICVDRARGRLYVADACNHRIAVYSLDGELRRYVGSAGRGPGELRYPYDLALLDDGRLLVCEFGNNRLQLFSPQGASLATFGRAGSAEGELAYPWGVAVDARGRAYVVDAGNNRVQVWQL